MWLVELQRKNNTFFLPKNERKRTNLRGHVPLMGMTPLHTPIHKQIPNTCSNLNAPKWKHTQRDRQRYRQIYTERELCSRVCHDPVRRSDIMAVLWLLAVCHVVGREMSWPCRCIIWSSGVDERRTLLRESETDQWTAAKWSYPQCFGHRKREIVTLHEHMGSWVVQWSKTLHPRCLCNTWFKFMLHHIQSWLGGAQLAQCCLGLAGVGRHYK
jgi:hypothetical protein